MTLQHIERPIGIGGHDGGNGFGSETLRFAGRTSVRILSRYGVLVGFLALWQVAASSGWVNAAVLPPIDTIVAALWKGLAGGSLLGDIAISLQRAGLAFVAAVVVAIPLGLVMGQVRAVETALDPILQLFRQTSALALYPVFILLLGLGEASKVFVIFWATLFPLLLNTISGVKEVDPKLLELAIVLTLMAASAVGFLNGYMVMRTKLPSFIVTLATFFILQGVNLGVTKAITNQVLVSLQRRLCRWSKTVG